MTKLPRNGRTREQDREKMLRVIEDPTTTVMVVRGDGQDVEDFVTVAERAEQRFRESRRLIWVTNESLLEPDEIASWFEDDDDLIARVMNDTSSLFQALRADQNSDDEVENAYLEAEAQRGA